MAYLQPHGAPPVDPGRAGMEYAASRGRLALHEDIFDHAHFDPEAAAAIDRYIESQEHLELKTVGIDIGSSTSHLLFAKIILEREAQDLSSRYVIVRRDIVWRSPIMLTPFTARARSMPKRWARSSTSATRCRHHARHDRQRRGDPHG